jgi:hypothetical protein
VFGREHLTYDERSLMVSPRLKMLPVKVLSGNPEPGLSIEEVEFISRFLRLADTLLDSDVESSEQEGEAA